MRTAWGSIARDGATIKNERICLSAKSELEAREIANDVRSAGLLARWLGNGDEYGIEVYEDVRKVQSVIGTGAPPEVVATLRNAVYAVMSVPPRPQGA